MGKAARDRSARERLAVDRERQAKRQKRVRKVTYTVGAMALVSVVVVAVVLTRSSDSGSTGYQGAMAPLSRQPDGTIVMAQAGVTRPVAEIYEDFQCPSCKEFETLNGPTLKELAAQGRVRVEYRPLQLFQQDPLKSNSARAANAALCAPADRWIAYHDLIYKHQPAEGSKGFSNSDLISWAKQAGITDPAFATCVKGDQKAAQLAQMTTYALQVAKVDSTPTVKLDGKKLGSDQTFSKSGLRKAIIAAGGGMRTAPAPTGS